MTEYLPNEQSSYKVCHRRWFVRYTTEIMVLVQYFTRLTWQAYIKLVPDFYRLIIIRDYGYDSCRYGIREKNIWCKIKVEYWCYNKAKDKDKAKIKDQAEMIPNYIVLSRI